MKEVKLRKSPQEQDRFPQVHPHGYTDYSDYLSNVWMDRTLQKEDEVV